MSSGEYSRLPIGELERLDPELEPRERDRLRDRCRDRDRPIPINLQANIYKDSKRVTDFNGNQLLIQSFVNICYVSS